MKHPPFTALIVIALATVCAALFVQQRWTAALTNIPPGPPVNQPPITATTSPFSAKGACCYANPKPFCTDSTTMNESDCKMIGGAFFSGKPCSAVATTEKDCMYPKGACCDNGNPTTWLCNNNVFEPDCTKIWLGTFFASASCPSLATNAACAPHAKGACCGSNSCSDSDKGSCNLFGSSFHFILGETCVQAATHDTACRSSSAPSKGACCRPTSKDCISIDSSHCGSGNDWFGGKSCAEVIGQPGCPKSLPSTSTSPR